VTHILGPLDPRLAAVQRLALSALSALPRIGTPAPREPGLPPTPQSTPAPLSPSVGLLVAIAAAEPQERRRRSTAAADAGLTALEKLHQGGPTQLAAVAAWAADHPQPEDSEAAALLRDVELRVLVELAKHERGD
jgi:hypothetical protein